MVQLKAFGLTEALWQKFGPNIYGMNQYRLLTQYCLGEAPGPPRDGPSNNNIFIDHICCITIVLI